jgi:hypothetical protein
MRRLGGLVVLYAATASPLSGQRAALREVHDRGSAGINLVVGQPLGEFRRHGNAAFGLTGFGVFGGPLGVRVDGAYLVYDANYLGYGVSTSSSIGTLAVGPQLTLGRGPLRVYGFATVGGSLFWSSASDRDYCGCYHGDDFFLDGHFTTTQQVGTGMLITIGRRRTSLAIDLGVRDMRHALVTYVPAGGISDNGDGTYTVEQVQTPVRLKVFQIGVSIGIR